MKPRRHLIVLQNAWRPKGRGKWAYDSWITALERSRAGQRLRTMLDWICDRGMPWASATTFYLTNSTPEIGDNPDSKLPPDLGHLREEIQIYKPDVIVPCGTQACKAVLEIWEGSVLCVPHPAYRLLTNRLYARAGAMLAGGWHDRAELRQLKGKTRLYKLP